MAQKFVRGADKQLPARQYQWMALATENRERALPDLKPTTLGQKRVETAQRQAKGLLPDENQDSLSVIQTADARFALPDGILKKVDYGSMMNSLEVRVPLLDRQIVEFAMSLPREFTITRSTRKRVLKEAFADVLPEQIHNRQKRGFEIPVGEWIKNELATEFIETVRAADTDLIDADVVEELHREHSRGSKDHTHFLWSVYVFARWYQNMRREDIIS